MADHNETVDAECQRVHAALARGDPATDWDRVEQHLATCPSCAAGLQRLTAAVQEQFAASRARDEAEALPLPAAATIPTSVAVLGGEPGDGHIITFPDRRRASPPGRAAAARRLRRPRILAAVGAAAAALVVLIVALALGLGSSAGSSKVSADRRPEFVPSLDVLPARADHTYYAGEPIQVCLRINQPSRIQLSVLEGHTTFTLYDADSDPGQHCFPEQVKTIHGHATLRVEVFYGAERVAREDFVLLPAVATP